MRLFYFYILVFVWPAIAWTQDYELYTKDGSQIPEYNRTVRNLFSDDRLFFSDGSIFKIEAYLDHGHTTRVFRVSLPGKAENYALRLPFSAGMHTVSWNYSAYPYTYYINETIHGYETLRKAGVPTTPLISSLLSQYVLMEFVKNPITLEDFLINPGNLRNDIRKESREALLAFAKDTAIFDVIGDFKCENLIYRTDKKRWEMIDWTNRISPSSLRESGIKINLFSKDRQRVFYTTHRETGWTRAIFAELEEAVLKARKIHPNFQCNESYRRLSL